MKLLIVGCGYVGCEVAKRLLENPAREGAFTPGAVAPSTVVALTRSAARGRELERLGIEPIVGDWLNPATLTDLPIVEHVLVSVPHRPVDDHGVNTHVRGLSNLTQALRSGVEQLVYLSTTGVYGASGSERVDETTPVSPTRIGPEIAVAAETWLQDFQSPSGPRSTVLRLAGIYGRGRIPLATELLSGEPLAVPRQGHLNLAHVVDISRLIIHLLQHPATQSLYVFSDGHPVIREVFYRELARRCGVENPRFQQPDASDPRVRRATDKRVDPSRIVEETGFQYLFPDYSAGVADAVAGLLE